MHRHLPPTLAFVFFSVGCVAPTPGLTDALPLGADSESCGSCHTEHYQQWAGSPHANASASPIFQAMLPDVEARWGLAARRRCEGCHRPEHVSEEPAIGCVSCHAASGNHAERDGLLAVSLEGGIGGRTGQSDATEAHQSRASPFLLSPSLCGTCHELTGPNLVREPTLTEFRASPAARAGLACADCHLPADDERAWTDSSRSIRPTTSHRFVGFDPPWGAEPAEAAEAAARTRALLADALELRVDPAEGGVLIVLANVGAGHSVPTGATFLRELWVDVHLESEVIERVLMLGDQPMEGELPVALLTHADHVVSGSLAAGEERRVFVATSGPVRAFLRGRAIRPSVLQALGREDLAAQVPTHEIHQAWGGPS